MDRLEANALHVPGQRHHRLCEGTAEREPELSLVLLPSVCRGTGSQKRLQGQERFARVSEMLLSSSGSQLLCSKVQAFMMPAAVGRL